MSKPKIKHKKQKPPSLPHAITNVIRRLEQQHTGAQFALAYIEPAMTPDEHRSAVFLTESIFTQLDKQEGPRMKMIVASLMFERMTGGAINYLRQKQLEASSREIEVHGKDRAIPGFVASSDADLKTMAAPGPVVATTFMADESAPVDPAVIGELHTSTHPDSLPDSSEFTPGLV